MLAELAEIAAGADAGPACGGAWACDGGEAAAERAAVADGDAEVDDDDVDDALVEAGLVRCPYWMGRCCTRVARTYFNTLGQHGPALIS